MESEFISGSTDLIELGSNTDPDMDPKHYLTTRRIAGNIEWAMWLHQSTTTGATRYRTEEPTNRTVLTRMMWNFGTSRPDRIRIRNDLKGRIRIRNDLKRRIRIRNNLKGRIRIWKKIILDPQDCSWRREGTTAVYLIMIFWLLGQRSVYAGLLHPSLFAGEWNLNRGLYLSTLVLLSIKGTVSGDTFNTVV